MRRTTYAVQAYRFRKRGGGLEATDAPQMRSETGCAGAGETAVRHGPVYAGVDAYKVTSDPKLGE